VKIEVDDKVLYKEDGREGKVCAEIKLGVYAVRWLQPNGEYTNCISLMYKDGLELKPRTQLKNTDVLMLIDLIGDALEENENCSGYDFNELREIRDILNKTK
jgi:hypothetical protein